MPWIDTNTNDGADMNRGVSIAHMSHLEARRSIDVILTLE
jgi:hypothetical protein